MARPKQPVVLLVEHRDDLYEQYSERLALAHFAVEGADTVADALARARRLRPAIVVADLGVRDKSGRSVAAALRQDPETATLPIVALAPDRHHAPTDAEYEQFLIKPCSADEVLEAVETLLAALPDARYDKPRVCA